ncbi:MAG: ribonuclease P protein component [Candidatus Peregrinibacteria bacterium]|nr:ribonuclease P protein component [Candidatus Peregrinibacteria bacterium]
MLARRYRLTKRDNIPAILKKGGMFMSKPLVIRFQKNNLDHHRFGAIVSQKIDSKAVNRNRVRRQIYEVLRLNYEQFPSDSHFDILILPKKAIIESTYPEIQDAILSLMPKLK